MSEWQPIETAPSEPMPVLFFSRGYDACLDWLPMREERVSVGFWNGKRFHVNGTGHEAHEDWGGDNSYWPTHWMPLPTPPIPEKGIAQ